MQALLTALALAEGMLRPSSAAGLRAVQHLARGQAQRCRAARAVSFLVPTEAAMQTLAAGLAAELHPGDAYLLQGTVGAGKTAFRHASAGVRSPLSAWRSLSLPAWLSWLCALQSSLHQGGDGGPRLSRGLSHLHAAEHLR